MFLEKILKQPPVTASHQHAVLVVLNGRRVFQCDRLVEDFDEFVVPWHKDPFFVVNRIPPDCIVKTFCRNAGQTQRIQIQAANEVAALPI